jgi:hypothetical protein
MWTLQKWRHGMMRGADTKEVMRLSRKLMPVWAMAEDGMEVVVAVDDVSRKCIS